MKFKRLMALAMAGVMTFAMAGTALAEGTEPTSTVPQITKNVTVAEGVTVNETFEFTGTNVANADGITSPALPANYSVTATVPVSGKLSEQTKEISAAADITFSPAITADDWKAGEYTFELSEDVLEDTSKIVSDTNKYGWTQDTTKFYLHVYKKSDGTILYGVTEANEASTEDEKIAKVDPAFTNIFTKQAGLTISKEVTGDYADLNTPFTFTVTFTASATAQVDSNGYAYKIGNTEKTVVSGGTITLKNGEAAVFDDIPAGITVNVVETAVTDYEDPPINITEDGTTKQAVTGLDSGNVILGEGENIIAYTNTYKTITPTGLAVSVAPFIAMFVAVGAAIALYVAAKRRVR